MNSRIQQGLILLVIVAGVSLTPLRSQADDESPAAEQSESPFSHSATPLQVRETRQQLGLAATAIEDGRASDAIELLRELSQSQNGAFVETIAIDGARSSAESEHFIGVSSAVRELLDRLKPDELRRYREQVEPLAQSALTAALRNGAAADLRTLSLRFPQTRAERAALESLSAQLLDHGRFREAEVALSRVAQHSLLPADRGNELRTRAQLVRRLAPTPGPGLENRSDRLFPEIDTPLWQRPSAAGTSTIRLVRDAFEVHSSQAIPRIPRAQPQIAGDLVIYREPQGLSAVDLQSGQVAWTAQGGDVRESAPLAINPALQHLVSRSLAKQLQLDSVQARFEIDDDLIFTAEWTRPETRTEFGAPGMRFDQDATSPARNGVAARRTSDGTIAWTLSTTDLPGSPDAAFFPGPPTVVDEQVIGQVRVGDSLQLYAVDRSSGNVVWTLPFAEAKGLATTNADHTAIACPVIEADGVLVCPTGAGLIVGIDLLTRTPAWAIRYPRTDLPPRIKRLPTIVSPARWHWWSGWREISHAISTEPQTGRKTLLLAGPDSDLLMAIDPLTGAIHWEKEIANPLELAGVAAESLICVERHAVTALSIHDGSARWRTPIHEPTGRGARLQLTTSDTTDVAQIDEHLVLPVRGGRFCAIRLSDGAVQLSDAGLSNFVGSVAVSDGRFVTQQVSGVTAWEGIETHPQGRPISPTPIGGNESPVAALHTRAREAVRRGRLVEAFQLYADALKQNPSAEVSAASIGPRRRIRHDRLIQGEVLDLIGLADAETRKQLRNQFDAWAREASDSADPFAIQRFVERWRGLPWSHELALKDESRIGFSFARSQLELLRLTSIDDDDVGTRAADRLASLYESRRYSRDAAAIRRAAGNDADRQPDESPWPKRPPTVSEQSERDADVGYRIVPVEAPQGSLFQRLNVAVSDDPNAMRVRFFGDGNSGYWQISLGRNNGPFRGFPMFAHGWGVGHFLILRVGAELFGITPYDSSGEPRARILWTRSLVSYQRFGSLQFDPSIPGFSINDLTILDGFDRPIGRVGPVTADSVCYQTGGSLVCLDTATGRRLWTRSELPGNRLVTGDARSIWLINPETGDVAVIRTLDSQKTDEFLLWENLPFSGTILHTHGNLVLLGQRVSREVSLNYDRVAVFDLAARRLSWISEPGGEQAYFSVGTKWIGQLSLDGQVRLLDAVSGAQVSQFEVERPAGLRTAFCTSDSDSHVIALTETAEVSFQQPRNVYRNPPLTGTLFAVDSYDGSLKWQRRLNSVRFAIDQPVNVPVLVLNYERKRAGENTGFDSMLQIIDRRTGADLRTRRGGTNEERFFIEPSLEQNRVSVRFKRRSIRLDYSAP